MSAASSSLGDVPPEGASSGGAPSEDATAGDVTAEDTAPARPTVAAPARRRLVVLLAVLAAGVLALDQGTKFWAEAALTRGESVPILGEWLQLTLVYNPGAAFSLATGMTWVLTVVAIGVVVAIVRFARRLRSRTWAIALGMLLGGALGNLGDRLFRSPGFPQGHVVDFIDYGVFVGNVADIAIVAAAGLIILLGIRGIGIDGVRHTDG